MIRRPPRSTRVRSSAASDVYKRQIENNAVLCGIVHHWNTAGCEHLERHERDIGRGQDETGYAAIVESTEFGWAEAVSYTHLRAHATVLDLVCRLLLEKKKK